jgi:hypothetical protein
MKVRLYDEGGGGMVGAPGESVHANAHHDRVTGCSRVAPPGDRFPPQRLSA